MICQNCGADNVDDAVFCCKCGSKIVIEQSKKICTQCGSELNDDDCFCTKCGTKVDSSGNDTAKEKKDFSTQSSSRFLFVTCILILPVVVCSVLGLFWDSFDSGFKKTLSRAEKGDAVAQFNLGRMYSDGDGVAKDEREAVKWWRKAAEQGYAKAQYNLGWGYMNGRGVAEDGREAVKWYRKAAEQGLKEAQCTLGVCYKSGIGVAKDEYEAVKWYRKAAEQGHENAKEALKRLGY